MAAKKTKSFVDAIVSGVTLSKSNKLLVAMEKVRGRHATAGRLQAALLDAQRARAIARRTTRVPSALEDAVGASS